MCLWMFASYVSALYMYLHVCVLYVFDPVSLCLSVCVNADVHCGLNNQQILPLPGLRDYALCVA